MLKVNVWRYLCCFRKIIYRKHILESRIKKHIGNKNVFEYLLRKII